jgi:putative thioredoxin
MREMANVSGAIAPQTKAASAVKEVTTASFRADVLTASTRQPVLVDFWAPWCGPCKQLAPALEKAVADAGGKVALVKMNIDDHPQIAGQLGIQSIPAVIAFDKGQPVDGFVGALPESQIRGFIERLVGPLEDGSAALVAEADELAAKGDADGAAALYSEILAEDPVDPKAIGGLAKLHVAAGRLDEAKVLLETAPLAPAGKEQDPAVAAASAALRLAEQASSVGELAPLEQAVAANPDDHQARFDLAVALSAKGDRAAAADQLLELIRRDRSWNDQAARKQLLQLFEAWGLMDPESVAARRKLSAIWF